jgi:hypothetical protein
MVLTGLRRSREVRAVANIPFWIVFVPLGAFVLIVALVWMGNRRKQVIAAYERDVQLALLAKFTTAEEMTHFLNLPEGRRLADQLARPKGLDPRRQVLEYLTGGLTTLFVGIALTLVARLGLKILAIPGFICIAVGLALLIAACFTYPVAKRLGLLADQESAPK